MEILKIFSFLLKILSFNQNIDDNFFEKEKINIVNKENNNIKQINFDLKSKLDINFKITFNTGPEETKNKIK
ncbi:hypothetical protein [Spiroplasma citri]|uniref:Uncharacterized protein n=1 Tax=Spiroplasma citri TaxID=2133 RepID=A0AAJ4EKE2_SPICI|nr:hypothetical protein [Spiroplasma citri]APE75267.1 hypothetical protein SCITRI_001392 [Spiroplasma citri]QIA67522.1 hypothetical protein GMI18_07760 [Spiroplasma citri]QIA69378.1 hypothetical protein GL298_07720 [Spiroplasma citri]QIA71243.1 hypothetical protein GL981_07765 [Spiroplasma citri]QIA73350.1 hypothetical protein GL982_06900 [Spiroplasma citri]